MSTKELTQNAIAGVLTPEALLTHWQGHRGLTRKMIEAFPDDKLFTYSIGGMRPFADLVYEFLGMAAPYHCLPPDKKRAAGCLAAPVPGPGGAAPGLVTRLDRK